MANSVTFDPSYVQAVGLSSNLEFTVTITNNTNAHMSSIVELLDNGYFSYSCTKSELRLAPYAQGTTQLSGRVVGARQIDELNTTVVFRYNGCTSSWQFPMCM